MSARSNEEHSREEINTRLKKIVEETVKQNPRQFPTPKALADIIGVSHDVLSDNLEPTFFEDLQIEWIRTSKEEDFLNAFSSGQLKKATGKVREEIDRRCLKLGIIRRTRSSTDSSATGGDRLTMRQRIALKLGSGKKLSPKEKEAYEKGEMFQLTSFRGAVALVKHLSSEGLMSENMLDFLSVGGIFERAYSYVDPKNSNPILHLDSLRGGESPSECLDDECADLIVAIYSLAPINSAKMLGAVVAEANRLLRLDGLFVATLPYNMELKQAHLEGLISLGFKPDVFEAIVSPKLMPLDSKLRRSRMEHKELWLFMEKVGPAEAEVELEPFEKMRVVANGETKKRTEPTSHYLEKEVIRSSEAALGKYDKHLLIPQLNSYAKLLMRLVEEGKRDRARDILHALVERTFEFTSLNPEMSKEVKNVFASIEDATNAFKKRFLDPQSEGSSFSRQYSTTGRKNNKHIPTKI